jgi:acyl-CoA reductase-like NAD-dependent aldehyde dehydrogenase
MPIPARSGGRAVSSDEWIEVLSPNDGAPVARVRASGAVHVAEAVAAAAATLARADLPQRRRAGVLGRPGRPAPAGPAAGGAQLC